MKKLLAILTAALMTASLAACSSTEESNSTKSNVTSSVSKEASDESGANDTSSTESSASSESSEVVLSELSMPDSAGDLLKVGLKSFFAELDEDKYRLNIHMTSTLGDPKVVIITRSGDSISAATGDTEDSLSKTVVKDDKGYVINDEEKTVTWAEFESGYAQGYTEYLATLFYVTNIEFSKSGKEKYGSADKEMDFEEYKVIIEESSTESSESSEEIEDQYVRYYFNNGEFAGMKVINGDDYYSLEIYSLTHEIAEDEFDIPSDYELIEAEESAEEESADSESSAAESSQA